MDTGDESPPAGGARIDPPGGARTGTGGERERLITAHLDLVGAVARQVSAGFPRHVEREELVRAGAVGLVEAANRFDRAIGVPFSTFAARRIRGAMLDSLRDQDWAPRSLRAAARRLDDAERALAGRLGRSPTHDEVGDEAGMTAGEVAAVRRREACAVVLTLDTFFEAEGEDVGLADLLSDPTVPEPSERVELAELHGDVQDAVRRLPPRHRRVVEGYFYEDRSTHALAAELGVSLSRISQLKGEALALLRDALLDRDRAPVTAIAS